MLLLFVSLLLALSSSLSSAAPEHSGDTLKGHKRWPIIDCGDLRSPSSTKKEEAAIAAIGEALSNRGFFFCRHALDADYVAQVYQASKRAHNLPAEEKQQYAHRGYTGPDVSADELAYEPTKRSTVMAWDYSQQAHAFSNASRNIYPAFLQEVASVLYDRQAALAKTILQAMARSLNLPAPTFSQHMEHGEFGTLRLLRYPATPPQDNLVGVGAHTDFEVFTLMYQDSEGLQVRARHNNTWELVPLVASASLVIVGDVLERLTNGVWQATPHRVLPTAHERHAIIRFNAFAGDTTIAPLPQFVSTERPAAYSTTTMAEMLQVTIANLEAGRGAWDAATDRSTTATYDYSPESTDDDVCEKVRSEQQ